MVNEKLTRFLLVTVGLLGFAAFGWKLYGYVQNQEQLNRALDIEKLEKTFGSLGASGTGSHLQTYANYAVLQDLNITGYVKPPPEVVANPNTGPKPRITPADIEVPMIQFPNAAWIQARGARAANDVIPGDFRVLGDRFTIDSKPDIKLELVAVREGEIDIKVIETEEVLTIRGEEYEVDAGQYLLKPGGASGTGGEGMTGTGGLVVSSTPEQTLETAPGNFQVGSADVRTIESMSQEEILTAVTVRRDRDPLSNEIRGLRIKSIQPGTAFDRLGLRADDVVLEVNGLPAVDRDQLFEELRSLGGDSLTVKVERLGGVRTLTYRLPRR